MPSYLNDAIGSQPWGFKDEDRSGDKAPWDDHGGVGPPCGSANPFSSVLIVPIHLHCEPDSAGRRVMPLSWTTLEGTPKILDDIGPRCMMR